MKYYFVLLIPYFLCGYCFHLSLSNSVLRKERLQQKEAQRSQEVQAIQRMMRKMTVMKTAMKTVMMMMMKMMKMKTRLKKEMNLCP